jgi:hypothetical protein
MLKRRLSLALLAILSSASLLKADILVLKNGDRKEGTIINESADVVRMKYRLTEKIWDEKDFPRAEIADVIRQRPSELAIQEQKIRELLPTADMLTADEYERVIQDRLRPFVNQHAGTPEATEVEGMIKTLQDEKEKVVSGQLKVDSNWLSPEEVKRDDYNIRAYKLRKEFQNLAASKRSEDWVQALRVYDRFIDQNTGFFASTHYPLMIPEVLTTLQNYEAVLLRMIREQPMLLKSQEDNIAKLIEPDLSRTKTAIKQKLDEWKSTYDAEKRSRIRWLVPYKLDATSLNEAHRAVVTERAKLQQLDLDALTKQNELLVAVFRYVSDENPIEAEAALENASKAALTNKQEYSRTFADLRGRITTLKNEIQRKKNAQRSFNAGTTAIGGGTGPIQDERVAQAMAQAQNPNTPPPATEDPNAPIGGTPAKPTPAPAPGGPAAPAPAPAPPPPASYSPPADEGGFPIIIPVAGGALLLVLILVMVLQKKKKS